MKFFVRSPRFLFKRFNKFLPLKNIDNFIPKSPTLGIAIRIKTRNSTRSALDVKSNVEQIWRCIKLTIKKQPKLKTIQHLQWNIAP
jgi:hypothetical protein